MLYTIEISTLHCLHFSTFLKNEANMSLNILICHNPFYQDSHYFLRCSIKNFFPYFKYIYQCFILKRFCNKVFIGFGNEELQISCLN